MEVTQMLEVYRNCQREVKTVKGAECERCPLSDDIWLSSPVQDNSGVLAEVRLKANPCLMLQALAQNIPA